MYKRYWIIKLDTRGFESVFLMYGTENEIQAYMIGEWGYTLSYRGAGEDEVTAARKLGIKAYLAPELTLVARKGTA